MPITPSYTERFGGSTIYPANPTFTSITTAIDITLSWPIEQATAGELIVAEIIELNATAAGVDVTLADATQMSQGYTALFNNIGANTFTVKDQGGNTLLTVASGLVWQLYLADNSTANGTWRIFQYGAGVSSANAAALAGAGLKAITTTLNQKATLNSKNANYILLNTDRAQAFLWTGGSGTFTLPDPAVVGNDWFAFVRNGGSGNLSVVASAGTIDGAASKVFLQTNSAILVTDGVNFYTIGFGQAINTVFDFVTIDVAGTGDYVLSGAELNRVSYEFHGILTGNRNIIIPTTIQQYWVDNETTGAFTLTVKTALGTGIVVGQTSRTILYCNGTNVINAETVVATVPVTIVQGGTGATTAAGARTNLGVPATADVVPITRTVTAGAGLTGGGDLSANRTFDVGAGTGITVNVNDVALDTASTRNTDHAVVSIVAGAGLTGGGDITTSRTIDIGAGTGITVNANDIAINQAFSPNWTGNHQFTPTSGLGIFVVADNNNYGISVLGDAASSQSFGLEIVAGTSASDIALSIRDQTGAVNRLTIFGDGGGVMGIATGANQGFGTLNTQGLFVNGDAVLTSASFPRIASGSFIGSGVAGASINVNSVTRTGAGQYTIDVTLAGFTTITSINMSSSNLATSQVFYNATVASATSINMVFRNGSGTNVDADAFFTVFGT